MSTKSRPGTLPPIDMPPIEGLTAEEVGHFGWREAGFPALPDFASGSWDATQPAGIEVER